MFDSYIETFQNRGDLYNAATALCPLARQGELQALLDRMALEDAGTVCDIPAGGGYVADGIRRAGQEQSWIVCIESSQRFAAGIAGRHPTVVGRHAPIPLASDSVDRVASLAGLHHLDDKRPFFAEAARILRLGGRVVVADVQRGTPPARFLNDAVHRLTETGHDGLFFAPGEPRALLAEAGLACVEETLCSLAWEFPDVSTLVRYCRLLFGMVRAGEAEVADEIRTALQVDEYPGGARLHWSLVYAVGVKP